MKVFSRILLEMQECCYWFGKYPELVDMYSLYGYDHLMCPTSYKYTPIPYYKQEGPQCGLAALAMIMKKATKENVDDLFECAKAAGYTNHGEMFSARQMCLLAKSKLPAYKVSLYKGNLNRNKIKQFLLNGGLMLVPYDCCADCVPTIGKGHQAHWAAVTGCFEKNGVFYVLARQGKSKLIGIWELRALSLSNRQLEEVAPARITDSLEYKLPEGGMGGPNGLKSQAVLIRPIDDKTE